MVGMTNTDNEMLLSFLAGQRDAVRHAVAGLDEKQARSVPSASALSLASLLNHVIDGERTMVERITDEVPAARAADPAAAWLAGWRVSDDETVADQLARWDAVATRTDAVVRAEADLDREVPIAPDVARWLPSPFGYSVRWLVMHQIEELARHAGHADIIRESIDGAVGHGPKQPPGEQTY
jgi:uncharacterized damage-inducible protein DinB